MTRTATLFAATAILAASAASAGELAGVEDSERARINYMLNCQGCHGADGGGMADGTVPNMTGFVGRFLHVDGGREFLVRVPGSANAALDNAALAEVLNWLLQTMSARELPTPFEPYTSSEVGELRKFPLTEIINRRQALVDALP